MKTKSRTKTTRRKSSVRGVAKVAGTAKTKKFGGKTYTKTSCSGTVTEARKKATAIKATGKLARVVKNVGGKGACVYSRGK